MTRRYPFAPLEALLRERGVTDMAAALGVDNIIVSRGRRDGLSELMADRLAVRAGVIPWALWPEWLDDTIAELQRVCSAHGCEERFIPAPRQPNQMYCSPTCKSRAWAAKDYKADPTRRKALVAAYDARNRAYAAQKSKNWRRLNPERAKAKDRRKYLRLKAAAAVAEEEGVA